MARSASLRSTVTETPIGRSSFRAIQALPYSGLVMTPQAMRGGAPLDGPPETA
jgi:hypothetical protein